ncbi:MAG: pantoate--beta-alanine ligase [Bacteroidales bacterium]
MRIFETVYDLKLFLNVERAQQKSIGLVPTMGALHAGHMALIRQAADENDVVVCSVFVNPIQFNKEEDLQNYPRTVSSDLEKLQAGGCDVVFIPSEEEMYPEPVEENYDFGPLEQVMEGRFRPGHFNGVAVVVRRLFEIVDPEKAYFGQKDYQQLIIIRKLVQMLNLNIDIVAVPIVREADGLAMSSRNMRLKPEERDAAPIIYKTLLYAKAQREKFDTPGHLIKWGTQQLQQQPLFDVEYFDIVDADSLQSIKQWSDTKRCILCVAVFVGKIRLIDNIILFS